MSKRRYRFGREAMQRFVDRNMLLMRTADGHQVPIWKRKRNAGGKGLNMWAFYIPKPQVTQPAEPEEPLVKVEVRDVEAQEPRTPNEEETTEPVLEADTESVGGTTEEPGDTE